MANNGNKTTQTIICEEVLKHKGLEAVERTNGTMDIGRPVYLIYQNAVVNDSVP